jgi:hypothetical protein
MAFQIEKYFGRRGSQWHAVPTKQSASTFPQASDEHLKSQVSREVCRSGTITWPPRSPDLIPPDFFF